MSVTFNQPMVALSTLEQLDQLEVPAEITPDVPGRWRWIGTRTLRFEVEPGRTDRLPMATNFTVRVPAGTVSASGAVLSEEVSWSFSTPPAVPTTLVPQSESLPLSPVFFLGFDQLVDPRAVLDATTVRAGDDDVAIRLATDKEVADDEAVAAAVATALEGRWLAFTPERPLPVDTAITVEVGPGTASEEGPRTSDQATTFSGRTYPPLRVTRSDCGYGGPCRPQMQWSIELSNPLDLDVFDPSMLTVRPELPGQVVSAFDSTIVVGGRSTGRTNYTVTLSGEIADQFGQTLGDDAEVDIRVGPAPDMLQGFDREFITLDPLAESKGVSVTTTNHDSVKVTVWQVAPDDIGQYRRYREAQWSDTRPPEPPWPVLLDEVVDVDAEPDAAVETFVDLSEALSESSQLVVRIAPTREYPNTSEEYWLNQSSVAWVQSTDLGIDAVIAADSLLVWTTDLATGEPRPNIEVGLIGDDRTFTTDDQGLATVSPMPRGVKGLVADGSDDRPALLLSSWYSGWEPFATTAGARWYVFDDRGIYKPGETVRFKGWVRRLDASDDPQLGLIGPDASVEYQVQDPQGVLVGSGAVEVNALGGFGFAADLPAGTNLGQAWVTFKLVGAAGLAFQETQHAFMVQEFRTPEFEVDARHESSAPYFLGDETTVAVDATYYARGPLPDAEVN